MNTWLAGQHNKGFTILEMVVSISLFSTLVIMVTSIMLIVSNAQRKTGAIHAVQDNARFIIQLLNKEMSTGTNFALTTYCAPGKEIKFISNNDFFFPNRFYFLQGTTLMRLKEIVTSSAQCASAKPLSGEETKIDQLIFSVRGQLPWPSLDGQPIVTTSIRISATDPKFGSETFMNLQSTITSRFRDIGP